MKYVVLLAIIISAFYIGATQLLLIQVNQLKYQYQNADNIAQAIVNDTNDHR